MVLKRKEPAKQSFEEEFDDPEEQEQEEEPQEERRTLPVPRPMKQRDEVGTVKPLGQVIGFEVIDADGNSHKFYGENAESTAACWGIVFKALRA